MRRKRVLFKFRHGLGDAVQFGIVLRHLLHYRPDWEVDVACLWGKHSVFHGLCRRVYDDHEGWPDESRYDEVHDIPWHESNVSRRDVPSTKATRCVLELGMEPIPDLCRYWMADNAVAAARVRQWLDSQDIPLNDAGKYRAAVVHHQGNTAMNEKNIDEIQSLAIPLACHDAGLRVIVLDWDHRTWMTRIPGVLLAPTGDQDIWGEHGTGDAAGIRELIKACELMIGIDSGPLHVAGTTDTRTVALWRAHHPARYYDLAFNVEHHVPGALLDEPTEVGEALRTIYRTRRCVHAWGEQGIAELLGDVLGQHGDVITFGGQNVRMMYAADDFSLNYTTFDLDNYRFREYAASHEVKLVVDVGANIGAFTRLVKDACPDARVIAIECEPGNLEALRRNVGGLPGVEIIDAACTYESGELILRDRVLPHSGGPGGWEVVRRDLEHQLREPGYTYRYQDEPVRRVTLEEVTGGQHIDLLKLDCEGSEYSILENTTCRPARIVMEWHVSRKRFEECKQKTAHIWKFRPLAASWPDVVDRGHATAVPVEYAKREPRYVAGALQIAVPAGIGDGAWCAMAMESLLSKYDATTIDVHICHGDPYRAGDYLSRFPFVRSCRMSEFRCVRPIQREDGIADYDCTGEGFHDQFDWLLVPNYELDRGQRIETCFPGLDLNWRVHDQWRFHEEERLAAETLSCSIGPYVVFYASSLQNNTTQGHNRNELWRPIEWVTLARMLRDLGLAVVVVGAEYDASYYSQKLVPAGIEELGVVNRIGLTSIGETLALCRQSVGVVAFQSGIGIVSLYMGANVAMWWRPNGDSQSAHCQLVVREEMATAWTPPGVVESGQYLPLIYTRCSPEQIANHVRDRWLRPNGHAVELDRSANRGDNLRTFGSTVEQTARG